MFKLRDYQEKISSDACEVLQRKKIIYLAMQVRCGKTITALETCKKFNAKKVLFITKKKAIGSIELDYNNFGYKFELTIINDESLHKITDIDFDVVIHDEHHRFGAFPKPNATAVLFKKKFGHLPMIFLSGTPTPESHSQWYHQFWVSNHSPFKDYTNFYKWANEYVDIVQKNLGYAKVNDYSNARKKEFWHRIRYYIISFTQQEAGFTTSVNEMVLECEMKPITYQIIKKLHKDFVVTSSVDGTQILADTGVKLQQKTHQLFSGTIKFEDGSYRVIDDTKACFIKHSFEGKKIGIFYKFVAELEMLKSVFGNELTTDLEEFNTTDKNIALQIVSGREGISLSKADYLVFMNIDFSAVSYFQARDRLTTMARKENTIFWVFSKSKNDLKSIEQEIYKSVLNKKDFTLNVFKTEFQINDKIKPIKSKRYNNI
jgi:hypothetical protein